MEARVQMTPATRDGKCHGCGDPTAGPRPGIPGASIGWVDKHPFCGRCCATGNPIPRNTADQESYRAQRDGRQAAPPPASTTPTGRSVGVIACPRCATTIHIIVE